MRNTENSVSKLNLYNLNFKYITLKSYFATVGHYTGQERVWFQTGLYYSVDVLLRINNQTSLGLSVFTNAIMKSKIKDYR